MDGLPKLTISDIHEIEDRHPAALGRKPLLTIWHEELRLVQHIKLIETRLALAEAVCRDVRPYVALQPVLQESYEAWRVHVNQS